MKLLRDRHLRASERIGSGRRPSGMTRSIAAVLLALTVAGTVASCAKPGDLTGSDGDRLPAGRTFVSTSIKANGQAVPWAAGTGVTLSFTDTEVGGTGGCNHLGGRARLSAGRLIVADLGSTEMACPEPRMSQDQWVVDLLTGSPTFTIDGDTLTLKGADGKELVMLDRKVADPDRPLTGVRWDIDTLIDGQTAASMPAGVTAFLQFGTDGKFNGNDGCNTILGSFTVAGNRLTFGDISGTKMACLDARGATATTIRAVLTAPLTYQIDARRLTLTSDNGHGLAAAVKQ
jgi:heat shock protein HslJ